MTSDERRAEQKPWEIELYTTLHPAFQLIPVMLLAFGYLLTELVNPEPRTALLVMSGLCVLVTAWVFWWINIRHAVRTMGVSYAVFFLGLLPMLGLLVYISGWFGFFMVIGYGYALRLPWRWRMAGISAMAVVTALAQVSGSAHHITAGHVATFVGVYIIDAAAICGLAWYLQINATRSDQREDTLTELAEANRKLEATLAENAGLHAQLLTQAREAGIHDERQRMAREIHDTLAQGLTGIITQLQAAEQASDDPAGWRKHFAAATRLARESLTEARRSVDALRPEPLESARLGDALAVVAASWEMLHGIPVQVTTTGDERPLPPEAEFVLLRTGQEALANVAKHARATRVGLTLSYMEHEVALDVRDDGRGFDLSELQAEPEGNGFGLVAMRQRVEGLCGTLQVESEPGGGTAISACLPVTVPAPDRVPDRVLV
jgi:signal transduction histidine kinase